MTTAKQTKNAVDRIGSQPLVSDAWGADRGYVIAVLDRSATSGTIFQVIDVAKHLEMDGEIRIVTEFMHKGEKRETIHFESVERVQPPVS